jgi:small GTP-binding protein
MINQYTVKAQIWDTAGQERFESMTKAYFRNACGAILVYDIGNRQSFENMKNKWLVQLREFGHEDIFVLIVGNKCDMNGKRIISVGEAAEFAESCGLDFIETSARTGENVEVAFRRVIISVARLLPVIKDHIKSQNVPSGWLYLPDKQKYINLWTTDLVEDKPTEEAKSGLIVTANRLISEDIAFRDSAWFVPLSRA